MFTFIDPAVVLYTNSANGLALRDCMPIPSVTEELGGTSILDAVGKTLALAVPSANKTEFVVSGLKTSIVWQLLGIDVAGATLLVLFAVACVASMLLDELAI